VTVNHRFKKSEKPGETFEEVCARRVARRSFLKSSLAALPVVALAPTLLATTSTAASPDKLIFEPVALGNQDQVIVPSGYTTQPLLRWGDPLFVDAPAFDPNNLTPEAQRRQFGYNCDFLSFLPLPLGKSKNSKRGLLFVNHEYTNPELMFSGYNANNTTGVIVDIELAAHGNSIVEIEKRGGQWRYVMRSTFNRRITAETRMEIEGPAAGHEWLKTSYDPSGSFVYGTLNNCGGGRTPWGTVITAEENFNQYFANLNALPASDPRKAIHTRYGVTGGATERRWENFYHRFDVGKEPNEAFRFGWVVEIDPYNPNWIPRKRTALGRMKHEAAASTVSKHNKFVAYLGDDERFDYLYKFVSRLYVTSDRAANSNLLDDGTLYVAKFNDDGSGVWIPLIAGQGALASWSSEEVLINTRGAGDAVGATKMDRPEDIEVNPVNGKIYGAFTNNTQRGTSGRPATDAANPRAANRHGQIIELTETAGDPAADTFDWDIFMLCGDPAVAADAAYFGGFDKTKVSPISCPDNVNFDKQGNLWIATDGMASRLQKNDGIYVVPVEGDERGFVRQFVNSVKDCETASLELTPNSENLFVSIQHPGEGSTFDNPSSLFPDGTKPPRPTVIAVTRSDNNGSGILGA
jgi:uncharacterized protein